MGVWNSFERSYCDVRVTHHGAQSHMHKSLAQLHAENEREKNTLYADRIKQIEKSVFHNPRPDIQHVWWYGERL